jgi:CheY-like chemotaxis protein
MNKIYPYYHPTQVVLIDDDIGFLNSLSRQLKSNILFSCYTDVKAALEDINSLHHPGIYESCRGTPTDQIGSLSAQLVPWDFSCIIEQALNAQRFHESSVAVIDYYMPSMNGLELCAGIARPEVRKILLTGVFDTSEAISALNDDTISAYLNKNDADLSDKINALIEKQQQAYFTEINKRFYASGADIPDFLVDDAFRKYFSDILNKYNICEYYLSTDPFSIFMLGEEKKDYYRLLIYNDAEMRAQWEIAESQYAPSELVKKLALNNVIPDFWESGGVYDPAYAETWKQHVYEPVILQNDRHENYYCHLQHQPASCRELVSKITDFSSTRQELSHCF